MLKLRDFDYELPRKLIAQYPLKKRDTSRLLIIDREKGKIYHDKFFNLIKYLPSSATLILNNSKVIPARILGRRQNSSGKVEVLLLNRLKDKYTFNALIKPLSRLKPFEKVILNNGKIFFQLLDPKERIIRFNTDIMKYLGKIGHMPLPPYIKRPDDAGDRDYYQTVYAKDKGSIASPTAGLHFSKNLLNKLKKSDIDTVYLTLHINYATFKSIETQDIKDHKMHSEFFKISKHAIKKIRDTKSKGSKIVAVGTTSCRVLETMAEIISNYKLLINNYSGWTDLYIYPGYKFKVADCLLTNFHLPRTTLFVMVCAFAGRNLIFKAYRKAIEKGYRFYSYGDSMLIV